MDMSEVKSFNAELSGLYDNKPPISKAKMSAITKGAIKAIKFYKHVVHSVEKFIQKCKPEYKVPGLYVIDSIVRQSRHQFGADKDVFAPRFAKNMQQTFANLFRCPPEDKRNIIRVLNLWQKNHVFSPDVIQPLMDMADPNHPIHQEIQQQQNNTANGSSLNVSHNTTDNKISPVPQAQHTPHVSTPMGDQFQDQPSGGSNVKFNRKLLNDFEYDSEDDAPPDPLPPPPPQQNPADALGSILTNPEIMRQLQSLQAQMQMMTGMQIPNLMPMMSEMQLQQQNQNAPFLGSQQEQQKPPEQKDEVAVESDIEFVDSGPQVIEIPDANDSRSPSPRSRRHRSRSKSPRRRRRSRSRSPRRRRDRERDRDRDPKSHKDREAEREKQKEREKRGLPPIKKDHLSVCSTTLWVGHLSKLATQEELSDLFGSIGGVVSIDVVAPRGCAFVVMERRRDAAKALSKLNKHKLHSKEITVAWAPGKGVKGREWKDYWEAELGVSYLPWNALQQRWRLGALSLDALEDGGAVDEDTLPEWLPARILPKIMDNVGMVGPPLGAGGVLLPMPHPAMPVRLPPPGMPGGIPPGMAPALPPGLRPPSIPTGVPGLQGDAGLPPAGPLLGFPPGMPPQSLGQPGMVGGFLGSLLGVGVGGLMPMPPPQPAAQPPQPQHIAEPTCVNHTDDAMDLDNEDNGDDNTNADKQDPQPNVLSEQLQALLSKPPPNFNSSEPPPAFNSSEPPPPFTSAPPPTDDKQSQDDDRKRDRRDRDRDRRDRDRGDRDRRDRDRDRERDGRRDRPRDKDRDRDDRRDRDRDRGRDRRDRDRDRDSRFSARDNNSDRSRERSPRNTSNTSEPGNEKSLQERLWEMANGPTRQEERSQGEFREQDFRSQGSSEYDNREDRRDDSRDRPSLLERPPGRPEQNTDSNDESSAPAEDGGWSQIPPQRPLHMAPGFRAELRMRGPPGQPPRGPWMEGPGGPGGPVGPLGPGGPLGPMGPGGPFGPRFNGMGPPPFSRPPFDRPPFDGMFDRPPFNRMPFDMTRPPFDGPRMPFDGPRMPFDGPRPPFDGPRPPFDGPRPPFDGPRPPFDGPRPPFDGPRPPFDVMRPPLRPPFDGPGPFDGPRPPFDDDRSFNGSGEFFDRGNRREDREQFNDRWSGERRDERRRDRRGNWDSNEYNRDNNEFNREKSDRRRSEPERPRRDEKPPRRDRDRKSRWGAPETQAEDEQKENKTESSEPDLNTGELNIPKQDTRQQDDIESQENQTNKSNAEVSQNETEMKEVPENTADTIYQPTEDFDLDTKRERFESRMEVSEEPINTDDTKENFNNDISDNNLEAQIKEITQHEEETTSNELYSSKDLERSENFNMKESEPSGEVKEAASLDLYDAGDVIDTSFAQQVINDDVSQVDKETLSDQVETIKDIFNDNKEQNAEAETQISESKETPA